MAGDYRYADSVDIGRGLQIRGLSAKDKITDYSCIRFNYL